MPLRFCAGRKSIVNYLQSLDWTNTSFLLSCVVLRPLSDYVGLHSSVKISKGKLTKAINNMLLELRKPRKLRGKRGDAGKDDGHKLGRQPRTGGQETPGENSLKSPRRSLPKSPLKSPRTRLSPRKTVQKSSSLNSSVQTRESSLDAACANYGSPASSGSLYEYICENPASSPVSSGGPIAARKLSFKEF